MSKVLVTGGAGFIGSHLVDKLVEMGNEVVIVDNLEEQVHTKRPNYLPHEAQYVFEDIRDKSVLAKAVEDVDVIFHEAAAVGVGQSMYQISKYVDVNTMATARLLDILVNKEHEVKKVIVASSMSVYGEGAYECEECGVVYPVSRREEQLKERLWEMRCPHCVSIVKPVPTDEGKPLNPSSIYAITKRDQEEMFLTIGKAYSIPTVALRYFNVYGPRQSLNNPYTGVGAIFSSRIKANKPPLIFEDGLQSRDFISVHDIVKANLLALENSKADYEVFNVGTGKPITISEIAESLIKLYEKEINPKIVNKYRSGDIRHCYADISKIKEKLGFEPRISLERGVQELISWAEKEEAEDKSEEAYEELKRKGLVED